VQTTIIGRYLRNKKKKKKGGGKSIGLWLTGVLGKLRILKFPKSIQERGRRERELILSFFGKKD